MIAGVYWDDPDAEPPPLDQLGAFIWDAQDGHLERRVDLGPCGGIVTAVSQDRLLVRTPQRTADGEQPCGFGDTPAVEVVDLASGETKVLAASAGLGFGSTMSRDGRFAAFDRIDDGALTSIVLDLQSNETVLEIDPLVTNGIQYQSYARRLNADGSLLLYGNRPILVYDVASGESDPIAELGGQSGESQFAEFDASGDTVYETGRDRTLRQWDARDGTELSVWPAVGNGRPSLSADDGNRPGSGCASASRSTPGHSTSRRDRSDRNLSRVWPWLRPRDRSRRRGRVCDAQRGLRRRRRCERHAHRRSRRTDASPFRSRVRRAVGEHLA